MKKRKVTRSSTMTAWEAFRVLDEFNRQGTRKIEEVKEAIKVISGYGARTRFMTRVVAEAEKKMGETNDIGK